MSLVGIILSVLFFPFSIPVLLYMLCVRQREQNDRLFALLVAQQSQQPSWQIWQPRRPPPPPTANSPIISKLNPGRFSTS